MRKLWAILAAILPAFPAHGEHWVRLESANFEMYSSASETDARDTLRYFEQVHAFISQAFVRAAQHHEPVCIVDFSSQKEFDRYRINGIASAYASAGSGRDFIVLNRAGANYFETAIHEYVHVLASRATMNLPLWLNEGLADLYSTLRPTRGAVVIGAPLRGRLFSIRRENWTPLSTILEAGRDSPYYSEKDQASAFYSEAWALTHMLMFGPGYKAGFGQFLEVIQHGEPSEKALTEIYEKPLSQIERELRTYLEKRDFQGLKVPVRFDEQDAKVKVDAAPSFDLRVRLAELMNQAGKAQESREMLKALAIERPERPEAYAALGYMKWFAGDRTAAARDFEIAFQHGSREPRLLWDYGRIAALASADQAEQAFTELLKNYPERNDVRFELAFLKLRRLDFTAALEVVRPIENPDAQERIKRSEIEAYAELGRDHPEQARQAAMDLARVALEEPDQLEAERVLRFIETKPATSASHSVAGSLIEVECEETRANLIVGTTAGRKVFLAGTPVAAELQDGSTRLLACGLQHVGAVRVTYEASTITGLDGIVRRIQFEP